MKLTLNNIYHFLLVSFAVAALLVALSAMLRPFINGAVRRRARRL
jgi:hypothetical protein